MLRFADLEQDAALVELARKLASASRPRRRSAPTCSSNAGSPAARACCGLTCAAGVLSAIRRRRVESSPPIILETPVGRPGREGDSTPRFPTGGRPKSTIEYPAPPAHMLAILASRIMRTRLSRDVWLNKPPRLPDIDPLVSSPTPARSPASAPALRLECRCWRRSLAAPSRRGVLLGMRAGEIGWLRGCWWPTALPVVALPVAAVTKRGGWNLLAGIGNGRLGRRCSPTRDLRSPPRRRRDDRRDARYHRALVASDSAATPVGEALSVQLKRRAR